jgi:hypothetical protein
MRFADLGPLPLSIMVSLGIAVVILAVRVFVLVRMRQRHQRENQRENRQETERLRSLVVAYRSLAGSFTPATADQRGQLEEALAEVVLFGTVRQVELAVACVQAIQRQEAPGYQALVDDLRADLREQLGLEPIPAELHIPAAGPGRPRQPGRPGNAKGGPASPALRDEVD